MKKEMIVCDHCGHVYNEEEKRVWIRLSDGGDGFSSVDMYIESLDGIYSKTIKACSIYEGDYCSLECFEKYHPYIQKYNELTR